MTMQCARFLMVVIAGAIVVLGVSMPRLSGAGLAQPAPAVHATRLAQNPLITVNTSASLGGNVNGPTVIRVPEIVVDPVRKRVVMWYHGWWTNGERWPSDLVAARAAQRGWAFSQCRSGDRTALRC